MIPGTVPSILCLLAALSAVADAGGLFKSCTNSGDCDGADKNLLKPKPSFLPSKLTKPAPSIFGGCISCVDDVDDTNTIDCIDGCLRTPYMFGGSFTGSGCPPGSVQVEDTLHWFPHQGDNWFALMFSSDFASVFGDMYHFDQASKSCHLELGFYVPDGWQFSISGLTYDLGLSLSPNVTAIQSTAFSFSQDSLNPSQSTRKGTIWRGPIRGDSLFAEVAIPESKQTWSQCNTIALPAANLKQDLVPPFLMPARDHFSTVILSIQSSNKIVSDTVFGKLARTAVKGSSQAGTASAATEIDLHEALYQLVEYGKFTTDTFDEIRHTFKMNWRRC